jgi:protein-disulfide isomerase-like protein with CxxC motif
LCGWCYGFTVVKESIYSKYRGKVDFNVVRCGQSLGERAGFINDVALYIKEGAYLQVEKQQE